VISQGITDTEMLAFGSILSDQQLSDLVALIRTFPPPPSSAQGTPTAQPLPSKPTFNEDVLPIFEQYCKMCHGTLGGWDSTSYQAVMTSGDHGPAVIPGDSINSLLAQKLQGTSNFGDIMPPSGELR
jgi:hypothetical protein